MSLQTPAFIPRDMRSNMLCVYCYQDKNPKGYVHSPWTGERHRFSSAMELLLCLEALMDERNSPRPTTELRGKHEAFRLEYDEETGETPEWGVYRVATITNTGFNALGKLLPISLWKAMKNIVNIMSRNIMTIYNNLSFRFWTWQQDSNLHIFQRELTFGSYTWDSVALPFELYHVM